MQFIVFVAFAIVLSVPPDGPPWKTIHSPKWTAAIVIGYVVLAAIVSAVCARLVKKKLDTDPAWLPAAQRRMGQSHLIVRMLLIGGFVISVYLTDWSRYVRAVAWFKPIFGLDEMVILAPFLLAVTLSWVMLYPADRGIRQVSLEQRLWASQPGHPVWGLRAYLTFMFRHHVLIILLPMVPILVMIDAVGKEHFGPKIRAVTRIFWADQAVLVAVAGLVFLVAPVMLRYVWHTQALPPGELRGRLEDLCRRIGLRYRQILIWQSDGMVVNAAVMGLVRPVRYILLSDGLLEMMDDRKIEAVFGHEAGHIKHHHITFYLLFAIVSMLIVGGVNELVFRGCPTLVRHYPQTRDYMQVLAMGLIVLVWGVAFGPVSRRFEWQADLFGARSVTPPGEKCDHPCIVHGTATAPTTPLPGACSDPVCATAANIFGEALQRIAVLNGIPLEARSWRHSSIANRIRLLKQYGLDPQAIHHLDRSVVAIKIILTIGTVIGLSIAAWLYWPTKFFQQFHG